ncbi:MAG: alpha/beta hydrolase [Pseudomonadota bacterium]
MTLEAAPLFTDVMPGPDARAAYWATTSDGLRIRLGHWGVPEGAKGTVLFFPGRTEYVEKYALVAGALLERGYATLTIDWRGQGLASRMLDEPRVGHVESFMDYQTDIAAMLDAARALSLPEPFFLMGHSMGGCIGLRALHEGLPVAAAAFTGPMWGIRIPQHMQPLAWVLGRLMPAIGQGHSLPPSTKIQSYVLADPFENNLLTRDREMWDMMGNHLRAHPELQLGGPSYIWLHQALMECNALARLPAPSVPCIVFQGTNERIVHTGRIADQMARWPNGTLRLIAGGEHEVLMEGPAVRGAILDEVVAHFEGAEQSAVA